MKRCRSVRVHSRLKAGSRRQRIAFVLIGGKRFTARGISNYNSVVVCGRTATPEGAAPVRLRQIKGK